MKVREFKEGFKNKYKGLLGEKAQKFFEYLNKPLDRAIRVNDLKIEKEQLINRLKKKYDWELEEVDWCDKAYWIREKDRPIGNTMEYSLGYYYAQEPGSLVPVLALNPKPREKVLDLCASPGSKTTQIAQEVENKGILVANDVEIEKISILSFNIQRYGVSNCVITLEDGREFRKKKQKFDRILVDAPCTGIGAMRREPHIAKMWSEDDAERLSGIQKQLIEAAFSCLKEGGTLVYSTCSLAPEEDESVIQSLLGKTEARIQEFEIQGLKTRPGMLRYKGKDYNSKMEKTKRIWPQDNDTGGFFIAKIKK